MIPVIYSVVNIIKRLRGKKGEEEDEQDLERENAKAKED